MPHIISGRLDVQGANSRLRVYAVDFEQGNYLGVHSVVDAENRYLLEFSSARTDVMVMVSQDLQEWEAGLDLKVGDVVYTSGLHDLVLEVEVAGVTGSDEPKGFNLGGVVADGSVSYKVIRLLKPVVLSLKDTVEV